MTAPGSQTPGGKREDIALAIGDAILAIMSFTSRTAYALIPIALRRAQRVGGRNAARRLHTQTAALFTEAALQANVTIDAAEQRITTETTATLRTHGGATIGRIVDDIYTPAAATSWSRLRDTLLAATRNAVADIDDTFTRALDAINSSPTGMADAQQILDELAARGPTAYVDAAGRRWGLASYTRMVTRTAASRLALAVQLHLMASAELDLVMVDKATVAAACPQCAPYEYTVLSITGRTQVGTAMSVVDSTGAWQFVMVKDTLPRAVARGLLHPSCRHFLVPFADGMTMTVPLPSARSDGPSYEVMQRQRGLQRSVRQHTAASILALTPMAKARANRRLVAARKRLYQHAGKYHLGRQHREPQVRAS